MVSTWGLAIASNTPIRWRLQVCLLCSCLLSSSQLLAVTYLDSDKFIKDSFRGEPKRHTLWLKQELQTVANRVLGHPYSGLRIRYWQLADRTAWILDEIGKERPITIGIVVEGGEISDLTILAYRESRGGEIRHPFFLNQFSGLTLNSDYSLNGIIDGVSGATLSVRAVRNISRFALHLHNVALAQGQKP